DFCEQSRAVALQHIFIHKRKILAVKLALGIAIRLLEDVVVWIPRYPGCWIAVGVVHGVSVELDGTETIDQPAHTQHARIVRTDRDEVEVILVERALEIVFPSPVQDSLVNAAHVCPEGGCVIDHRRGTQFLPHLLYGLTSCRGEQACGSAGLVQIPYNWRMSAGRRAAVLRHMPDRVAHHRARSAERHLRGGTG